MVTSFFLPFDISVLHHRCAWAFVWRFRGIGGTGGIFVSSDSFLYVISMVPDRVGVTEGWGWGLACSHGGGVVDAGVGGIDEFKNSLITLWSAS